MSDPALAARLPATTETIEVQFCSDEKTPDADRLRLWAVRVFPDRDYSLTLRVVDAGEMAALNGQFRNRPQPTNVLSFPFEEAAAGEGLASDAAASSEMQSYLGDIVVCAPVVGREARDQGQAPERHWAHLVVHGVLHLFGYDHENDGDALVMEGLEKRILERFTREGLIPFR